METSSIYLLFLGIIFSVLPHCAFEELVSCRLGQICVLPCRYEGQLDMIHWSRQPEDYIVHVYVKDRDDLRNQHPLYSKRTSLSEDRSRGDASLLLSQVTLKDQGRFRCFTSSSRGDQSHSLELTVFAPVLQMSLEQEGQKLVCRSEGIYPRPSVVWSVSTEAVTTVSESDQGLFSVSSSVSLSDSEDKYICNISTPQSWQTLWLQFKWPNYNLMIGGLVLLFLLICLCYFGFPCCKGSAVVSYSAASGQVYVRVHPHDPLEEEEAEEEEEKKKKKKKKKQRKKKSSCPTTRMENEGIQLAAYETP